jgi:hypothetical protein
MRKSLYFYLVLTSLAFGQGGFNPVAPELTDAEQKEADTYVHQGINQNQAYEECQNFKSGNKNVGKSGCTQAGVDGIYDSTVDQLVPVISTIYPKIMGAMSMGGSGGIQMSKTMPKGQTPTGNNWKPSGNPGADGSQKYKKDSFDFCAMIPQATEMISLAKQTSEERRVEQQAQQNNNAGNTQYNSFMQLADVHNSKAKVNKVNAAGWGAAATCYTTMAVASGFAVRWDTYVKAAGSGLIAFYWGRKAKQHEAHRDELKRIAKTLPGAGDCNPHTDTNCFCAEDTSYSADPKNYVKYCVPLEYQNAKNPEKAYSCVDQNLKEDKACKCAATNNCFDKKLKAIGTKFDLGTNFATNMGKFNKLYNGSLGGAELDNMANRGAAFAKRLKDPQDLPKVSGIDKDKFKLLRDNGVSPGLAAYGASLKRTAASGAASRKFRAGAPRLTASQLAKNPDAIKTLTFKKGSNSRRKRGKSGSSNPFANFGKKKKEKVGGVEVMQFAQKATEAAEVNQNDDTSIFDIISHRYKKSGQDKLK